MTGKRTSWQQMPRQLRVDPELNTAIREIAKANFRQPSEQILYWLCRAVNEEIVGCGGKKWHVVRKEKSA